MQKNNWYFILIAIHNKTSGFVSPTNIFLSSWYDRNFSIKCKHRWEQFPLYNFNNNRRAGSPITTIKIYNSRDVDEIVLLDIDATKENRDPNLDIIKWASRECFVHLTFGGGIKKDEDIEMVLKVTIS